RSHRNACHSPAAVRLYPTTWPRSFTASARLIAPPSVPRSWTSITGSGPGPAMAGRAAAEAPVSVPTSSTRSTVLVDIGVPLKDEPVALLVAVHHQRNH